MIPAVVVVWLSLAVPPLTDLNVFPPHEAVEAQFDLAAEHNRWICSERWKAEREGNDSLAAWLIAWETDSDICYRAWLELKNATDPDLPETNRRIRLMHLRDAIGMRAYYSGRMLPPVPLWWFRRRE